MLRVRDLAAPKPHPASRKSYRDGLQTSKIIMQDLRPGFQSKKRRTDPSQRHVDIVPEMAALPKWMQNREKEESSEGGAIASKILRQEFLFPSSNYLERFRDTQSGVRDNTNLTQTSRGQSNQRRSRSGWRKQAWRVRIELVRGEPERRTTDI